MPSDHSLGDGVYYALDDYAGFLRRIAVAIVDGAVLVVLGTVLWIAVLAVVWDPATGEDPSGLFFMLWALVCWLYLTVLKRSKLRTVAYRLLRLKIVTTKGQRPSVFIMTFRMLMWLFGPFNFVLDLIWLGADSEQQSLRDCYAGTYVVRHTADPVGVAPLHLARYCGAGLTLVYPRVVRPKTHGPPDPVIH